MSEISTIRLGDLIGIKHGYAFPGDEFGVDQEYPTLVTPGNFAIGGGFKRAKPKTFTGSYPREYDLKSGDLIITMTDLSKEGDTLGMPAIVPAEGRFLHNQRIGLVEIMDPLRVDKTFLNYFLRSSDYHSYIMGTASGSTVRHTSPSRIRNFETRLPNVAVQIAIAEVLGALDDKIAANTKLAATAHDLAAHIYGQSTSPLGAVPMSTVLSPVLGGTPPRSRDDYWEGNELWASAKDITGANFATVVDTDEKISSSAIQETKAKPLPAGSVILTARGTVGAVGRLAVPASFNQSCYGFVPGEIPPGVLYFAIVQATQRAKVIAHGSVFDTITMKTFDHLEFPDFGGSTMANTETKIAPLLNTITGSVLENQRLAATRDALLPQLMSGKLRVKDAESIVLAAV